MGAVLDGVMEEVWGPHTMGEFLMEVWRRYGGVLDVGMGEVMEGVLDGVMEWVWEVLWRGCGCVG